MLSNSDIIDMMIERTTGVDNASQLATYLTDNYGVEVTRFMVYQFQKSNRTTLTHLLLREFASGE